MTAEEGERWGFFNRIVASENLEADAMTLAQPACERPDLRARHDQNHAAPGVRDAA